MGREDGGVGLRLPGRSNLVVPVKDTVRGRAPPEGDGGDDSAEAVAVRRGIIGVNQSSLPERKVNLKLLLVLKIIYISIVFLFKSLLCCLVPITCAML